MVVAARDAMPVYRHKRIEPPGDSPDVLCRRAWRQRRRGEERRAMVLLRQAAYESEDDPKVWALYGAQCLRMGRMEPGRKALCQAAWLRDRRGERRKAEVTKALLSAAMHHAA